MICSVVGGDQIRTVTARKEGYRTVTPELFGGSDFESHFELVRN